MSQMTQFQYVKVASLNELFQHLENGDQVKILAGGTDLIPQLKNQVFTVDEVIDIKDIPDLRRIAFDDTSLYLGAAVTCLRATSDQKLRENFPGLIDAISLVGGIQIQGRATIGGNVCNSSPAADTIPALIAHDAVCIIASATGIREIPVAQFCTGPGNNNLQKHEILQAIRVPLQGKGFGASYQRFIPRNEMDIAVVGVAAAVKIDQDRVIQHANVALGAVAPTPLGLDISSSLRGTSLNDPELESHIEAVAQQAKAAASPISDMRGSAKQRKHLVAVLTKRELQHAMQRAEQSLEVES